MQTNQQDQTIDLFGAFDVNEVLQQKQINDQKKAEEMKLIRADWFVAMTADGFLFKYHGKVPSEYKNQKKIRLFKCWNEATADQVLTCVKGAVKRKGFEIPDFRKPRNQTYAIKHWMYLVETRLRTLPYGHLINMFQKIEEKTEKKREAALLAAQQNTYDVEPH